MFMLIELIAVFLIDDHTDRRLYRLPTSGCPEPIPRGAESASSGRNTLIAPSSPPTDLGRLHPRLFPMQVCVTHPVAQWARVTSLTQD